MEEEESAMHEWIRNLPEDWKSLFKAAGVKKADLRDKETFKLIMGVIFKEIHLDELGRMPPLPPLAGLTDEIEALVKDKFARRASAEKAAKERQWQQEEAERVKKEQAAAKAAARNAEWDAPPSGAIPPNGRNVRWTKAQVGFLWTILTAKKAEDFLKTEGRPPSDTERQSWKVARGQLISALRSSPALKASLGFVSDLGFNESTGVRNVNYLARLVDALLTAVSAGDDRDVTYVMWLKLLGAGTTPFNKLTELPTAALTQYVCAVLDDVYVRLQ